MLQRFFLFETLELKYEPFDKKIMKIEGHFIFSPTEKLVKIQPL
jgi:hypothetical protein